MPAIASLEDLKAAQKELLEAKDLAELKAVFKRSRFQNIERFHPGYLNKLSTSPRLALFRISQSAFGRRYAPCAQRYARG